MVSKKVLCLCLLISTVSFFVIGLFSGLYFNNYLTKSTPLVVQLAQNAITDLIKTTKPETASLFILYTGTLQSLTNDQVTLSDKRIIPLNFSLGTPVEFRAQISSRSSVLTKKESFTAGSKVSLFIGADWIQNKINTITLTLDQQPPK